MSLKTAVALGATVRLPQRRHAEARAIRLPETHTHKQVLCLSHQHFFRSGAQTGLGSGQLVAVRCAPRACAPCRSSSDARFAGVLAVLSWLSRLPVNSRVCKQSEIDVLGRSCRKLKQTRDASSRRCEAQVRMQRAPGAQQRVVVLNRKARASVAAALGGEGRAALVARPACRRHFGCSRLVRRRRRGDPGGARGSVRVRRLLAHLARWLLADNLSGTRPGFPHSEVDLVTSPAPLRAPGGFGSDPRIADRHVADVV